MNKGHIRQSILYFYFVIYYIIYCLIIVRGLISIKPGILHSHLQCHIHIVFLVFVVVVICLLCFNTKHQFSFPLSSPLLLLASQASLFSNFSPFGGEYVN